jgi:DNA processing protein
MAVKSHDTRLNQLTIACLGPGPNAVLCRELKACASQGPVDPEKWAAHLEIEPSDRSQHIERARAQAAGWLAEAARLGVDLVTSDESMPGRYPARLAQIVDPPMALWRRGPASLDGGGEFGDKTVAIVGSRAATPAGLIVARQLSGDLARLGYTIISGLALGIDGAAHEAALAVEGLTVAVLGCGIDIVYPRRHARLARAVATSGCLVSEFPPGTPPLPHHFPMRNRIISGLSRAVVVVEASERSGSLITAKLASDQGRDVLAVPGSVASGKYRGCHALIRDGARLVETVADVIEELEGISAATGVPPRATPAPFISDLEPIMAQGELYTLDDLAERTGRPTQQLLAELGYLEVEGRVGRTPGGRFVRR